MSVSEVTTRLRVTGMDCPGCAETVEKRIRAVEGVSEVSVALLAGVATVNHRSDIVSLEQLRHAVEDVGYGIQTDPGDVKEQELTSQGIGRDKVLTVLSGLFFLSGMLVAWAVPESMRAFPWEGHIGLSGILYLAAALAGGMNFIPAGLRAVRTLSLDMNFLMMAAILGAAIIGEYAEVRTLGSRVTNYSEKLS